MVSMSRRRALAGSLLAIPALAPLPRRARAQGHSPIDRAVDEAIKLVMEKNRVPGMAVAVTVRGRRSQFHYGVASKESGQRVTADTLFEIGSLSKTFAATLACLGQAQGALALSDKASKYWPDSACHCAAPSRTTTRSATAQIESPERGIAAGRWRRSSRTDLVIRRRGTCASASA